MISSFQPWYMSNQWPKMDVRNTTNKQTFVFLHLTFHGHIRELYDLILLAFKNTS
jgi:hypothetical protein